MKLFAQRPPKVYMSTTVDIAVKLMLDDERSFAGWGYVDILACCSSRLAWHHVCPDCNLRQGPRFNRLELQPTETECAHL
jgi:hypothetical protein